MSDQDADGRSIGNFLALTLGRVGKGFDLDGVGPVDPGGEIATVWLNSLTATPGVVRPFEAATIAWDVHADVVRPRIELNGEPVDLVGSRVVTPHSSSTYRVVARTSNTTRELGRVDVDVDARACITYEPASMLHVLNGGWRLGLEDIDNIALKKEPRVVLEDGKIHLRADFGFELGRIPATGSGKIRATFGIGAVDRNVEPWGIDIDVELSVPWWVWAIPGAIIGLNLALGSERARARASVRDAIADLSRLVQFWSAPPSGMSLHSVRVQQDENGRDAIRVTACPDDPLRGLLGLGAAVEGNLAVRLNVDNDEGSYVE